MQWDANTEHGCPCRSELRLHCDDFSPQISSQSIFAASIHGSCACADSDAIRRRISARKLLIPSFLFGVETFHKRSPFIAAIAAAGWMTIQIRDFGMSPSKSSQRSTKQPSKTLTSLVHPWVILTSF